MITGNAPAYDSYAGNGATTAFTVTSRTFKDADVLVYVIASGIATLKTIVTHYTISGAGGATCTVNFVTAPATGETVLLIVDPDRLQELDLLTTGKVPMDRTEQELDHIVALIQRLKNRVDRAVRQSDTSTDALTLTLPAPSASQAIGWNSAGTGLANISSLSGAATTAFTLSLLDDANAAAFTATMHASLPEDTQGPEPVDFVHWYDVSAAAGRKTQWKSAKRGITSLPTHASDAAFITSKGSSAAAGDRYHDTTNNVVRWHDGTAWRTLWSNADHQYDLLALSRVRNLARNGEFRFFQRQTPATLTSRQDDQYGPDNWYILNSGGAVNTQVARVAEVISSSPTPYVCQVRQADATARRFGLAQIIRNDRAIGLRGKQVTFALQARTDGTEVPNLRLGIVEWTGTADTVTSDIVSAWAATPTLIANAAFVNTPADLALSGTMAQLQATATLGSTFNNLILFVWAAAEEAQNDDFYITQAQLVEWPEALPWNLIRKEYNDDYADCVSGYGFQKSYLIDTAPATVTNDNVFSFRSAQSAVEARRVKYNYAFATAPTVTYYNPNSGATGSWRDTSAGADRTVDSGISGTETEGTTYDCGGTTAGNAVLGHWTAEVEL